MVFGDSVNSPVVSDIRKYIPYSKLQCSETSQGNNVMIPKLPTLLVSFFCLTIPAMAQAIPEKPVVLIHGNYCGPGNRAPLAPIDALDAACARHDACTPEGALPAKSCNLRLQHEAAMISEDPRQPQDLRFMAGLVSAGASMMLATADPAPPTPVSAARLRPHLTAWTSRRGRVSAASPRHGLQ